MNHTCHAMGCGKPVPPRMFMCRQHWFSLSATMRNLVWSVYVPGQELRRDPSAEYLEVTNLIIQWLAHKEQKQVEEQDKVWLQLSDYCLAKGLEF